MNRMLLALLMVFAANEALAQEPDFSVTVGIRAWNARWTTFSYLANPAPPPPNLALVSITGDDKVALMPSLSVRYRDFFGSLSTLRSTTFSLPDGARGEREEFDVNAGYYFMKGLAVTLGYKTMEQSDGNQRYRPRGLVLGLSGSAPLSGSWSVYGNVGIGKFETPGGDVIDFEAQYRLAELGIAYAWETERFPKRWTFTGGYRTQVLTSNEAFGTQDARDTTDGFTLGVLATF